MLSFAKRLSFSSSRSSGRGGAAARSAISTAERTTRRLLHNRTAATALSFATRISGCVTHPKRISHRWPAQPRGSTRISGGGGGGSGIGIGTTGGAVRLPSAHGSCATTAAFHRAVVARRQRTGSANSTAAAAAPFSATIATTQQQRGGNYQFPGLGGAGAGAGGASTGRWRDHHTGHA
ncbi:unnamed protein product, partial [Pylaiella littoralis]